MQRMLLHTPLLYRWAFFLPSDGAKKASSLGSFVHSPMPASFLKCPIATLLCPLLGRPGPHPRASRVSEAFFYQLSLEWRHEAEDFTFFFKPSVGRKRRRYLVLRLTSPNCAIYRFIRNGRFLLASQTGKCASTWLNTGPGLCRRQLIEVSQGHQRGTFVASSIKAIRFAHNWVA